MKTKNTLLLVFFLGLFSCNEESDITPPREEMPFFEPNLTIFYVNDNHGRINNFSKIKSIVDEARNEGNVLLVSAGDIFAGNPIVDQFEQPGFPMIDIMNDVGFDVGTLGNHEFDFGTQVLEDRVNQSDFPWILANVDASNSVLSQPEPYVTLTIGEFRVTFLGVVETNGKDDAIPSTHPLRVADLSFQPYQDVMANFENLKAQEDADLLVGLTHLGSNGDRDLAFTSPWLDLIIGGHSHETINEVVNDVPVFQAGSNLRFLGMLELKIEDQEVVEYQNSLIPLSTVSQSDAELASKIETYNDDPSFAEVVGQSNFNHQSFDVGCFYTTALKEFMEVDFAIQNLGGVRAGIDRGPITREEIYTMDPFNNGSVIFTQPVGQYESFFCGTGSQFLFSGIHVDYSNNDFQIVDINGTPLPNDSLLTMGVNDFIPAVFDDYIDISKGELQTYTTAEAVIGYLQNINSTIDFGGCEQVLQCN